LGKGAGNVRTFGVAAKIGTGDLQYPDCTVMLVQHSKYITVQYSTVKYRRVLYSTKQYSELQYSTVK
jgi:hypothetical protein